MASRQVMLNAIGQKILTYADEYDGMLPPTKEAFIAANIIELEEWCFRDSERDIEIARELRPVPNSSYPSRFIIVVERYGPPMRDTEGQVLQLDGAAIWIHDLAEVLDEDDELRAKYERGIKKN